MWSHIIRLAFNVSMFYWITSACELKDFIDRGKKCIVIVLLRSFPNISFSPPLSTNHTHACHEQESFYFYMKVLFYLCTNSCAGTCI